MRPASRFPVLTALVLAAVALAIPLVAKNFLLFQLTMVMVYALATFALALAAPQLLKLSPLSRWTGGAQGIVIMKPEPPLGLRISADQWLYYLTLAILLLMYLCAERLVRGRCGRAIVAIRDNPIAARAMGIDVAMHKSLWFGVSAAFTGLAGALGAISVAFVSPDSFTFGLSVAMLVGLVVGGTGWLPGALFGGAFVLFVPNMAEHISKGMSGAVYGAILLLFIHLMPSGIGGITKLMAAKFKARTGP